MSTTKRIRASGSGAKSTKGGKKPQKKAVKGSGKSSEQKTAFKKSVKVKRKKN